MPLQSLDLHQSQDNPQTYVSASCLDTMDHTGKNSSRLDRDRQAGCLESPDLRHADEDQLMQKMLCCPLTKVSCKLHCSPSSVVSAPYCDSKIANFVSVKEGPREALFVRTDWFK